MEIVQHHVHLDFLISMAMCLKQHYITGIFNDSLLIPLGILIHDQMKCLLHIYIYNAIFHTKSEELRHKILQYILFLSVSPLLSQWMKL